VLAPCTSRGICGRAVRRIPPLCLCHFEHNVGLPPPPQSQFFHVRPHIPRTITVHDPPAAPVYYRRYLLQFVLAGHPFRRLPFPPRINHPGPLACLTSSSGRRSARPFRPTRLAGPVVAVPPYHISLDTAPADCILPPARGKSTRLSGLMLLLCRDIKGPEFLFGALARGYWFYRLW